MKISELIVFLEKIKQHQGDVRVCVSESHEYWGSVETLLEEWNITVSHGAQPDVPKSGKMETAVILGR